MNEALDSLEREMEQLRLVARTAHAERDLPKMQDACEQLRRTEDAWYARIGHPAHPATTAGLPPLRTKEQMRQALALIGAPAAPKTIRNVNLAFAGTDLPWSRLASIRRDEERRYASTAGAAGYICPALSGDSFVPLRGLYALSEWPLERRMRTPLSARVDFLTMVTRLAAHEQSSTAPVQELLRRLADEIPGVTANSRTSISEAVTKAANTELSTIGPADQEQRNTAAQAARLELDKFQQIFGAPRNRPSQAELS